MGNMSISSSMSFTNMTSGGSTSVERLKMQCNQISKQKESIKNDDSLTKKQKELKLQKLQDEIDQMNEQIAKQEKKSKKKEQQKHIEDEKQRLESTMDPETVELMMQIEKLTNMAVESDQTDADGVDELVEALEEIEVSDGTSVEPNETMPEDTVDTVDNWIDRNLDDENKLKIPKKYQVGDIVDEKI